MEIQPVLSRCARLAFFLAAFTARAGEPVESLPLWPGGKAPGDEALALPAESVELKGDHQIEIMSHVSVPTLTWYPADRDKNTGAAVLVCPGGGYSILAYSHEGKEVCEWLNRLGVNAGLLKYRVPRREGAPKHQAPLQDAQRAIGIIRSQSAAWGVDPQRVGILGFSAGGHLAATALASDGSRTYAPDPAWDAASCVPNFAILIYPAYLQNEQNPDRLSPEVRVSATTPPAFLAVAHGDRKFVEGAAVFYLAMRRQEREAELHIFAKGGHGFGLKNTGEEIKTWPDLAGKWMQAMGFLNH